MGERDYFCYNKWKLFFPFLRFFTHVVNRSEIRRVYSMRCKKNLV